ncbi:bifunctional isocitrate dehydrogenase kinase/phosphatase [Methylocaldum sp.]|uniref:bifunctional isocitrate dehydrogenase kinase/phosphatase n=1 Tax=Methylocaldum sp. TaxID=1969727 RepID=UPI002D2D494F|nr:bifunctional isocitrate dehydrogenase kinase/phosphatase [Methylocaldum sp.]HYE36260.1 bifunctional isocitrate dehydrogenase kinase/phosphatase [Methylocaldum sp.]
MDTPRGVGPAGLDYRHGPYCYESGIAMASIHPKGISDQPQPKAIAQLILSGFERHYAHVRKIAGSARQRFEAADWRAVQEAARERIYYYDLRVDETISDLRDGLGIITLDEPLWQRIKVEYVHLLYEHKQPELAETFYNSVFCRLFHRWYFNNKNIFVRHALSTEHLESEPPVYRIYYPGQDGFYQVIAKILGSFGFRLPFAHRRHDIRNLMRAIWQQFPDLAERQQNFHLAVLSTPFFRNKAAYIIGKIVNGPNEQPFAVPILNNERGGLYIDALLLGWEEVATLFSFTRAYFMVDTKVPSAVVEFLLPLLACKTKAELYTAIGLWKQGKTEFYRDFLHHLRHSTDAFVAAPGAKGMVMIVFTLPSYPYVFKVIKDRFPPAKKMTRQAVKDKYQLVKQHDRVGRMADFWEYTEAAFPLKRFAPKLLQTLQTEAGTSVSIEGEQLILRHVYIERRMTPLDLYVQTADDRELGRIIGDYGAALKELAAANIFPGDMFLKNFGVTGQGRVVFYDYDELCYLTECNFRKIPSPPYLELELEGEPWYWVAPHDVFPEEFITFLLTDSRLRNAFLDRHSDLLDADYWKQKQKRIAESRFEDVFPYAESKRFVASALHPSSGPNAAR